MIKRRKFVKNMGLFNVGSMVIPLEFLNVGKEKYVRFGIASDSHYADREPAGTRYYRQSLGKMREFVTEMNSEEVDFVIHLGDFKDEDRTKNEMSTLDYLKKIEQVYSEFRGPRFHCVGNHDVDSITKKQFLEHIENTDIPQDKSYYSFDIKGCHFVVLDANFNEDGSNHYFLEGTDWQNTNLTKEQLKWLELDLEQTENPTFIFCHHPLFEFNREGKKYHINKFEKVQQILNDSGKVLAVFQGHVHEERHIEIKGIHYITQNGMVDYQGWENNSFAMVEIRRNEMQLFGYQRANSNDFKLWMQKPVKVNH